MFDLNTDKTMSEKDMNITRKDIKYRRSWGSVTPIEKAEKSQKVYDRKKEKNKVKKHIKEFLDEY